MTLDQFMRNGDGTFGKPVLGSDLTIVGCTLPIGNAGCTLPIGNAVGIEIRDVCAALPSGTRVTGVARSQPAHLNALTLFFDRPPTEDDIRALHNRLAEAGKL